MTSRSRFSASLPSGLTVGQQHACITPSEPRSSKPGVMSMASAPTRSSERKSGTWLSGVPRRLAYQAALTLTVLSILSAARSATGNTFTSVQAEVGASYAVEAKPAFLLQGSAGYDRLSASFLAASVRGDPTVILASLRYSGDGFHVDAGRIGVSLGLTPPAYAATVPLASEPDIHPSINRAILRAVGLPSAGAGLTVGGFSVRFYAPTEATQTDLAIVASPASTVREVGPVTPNTCSLCDFTNALIGVDLNPTFAPDTMALITQRTVTQVAQVGYEWANANWRVVLDGASARINGHAVGLGFAGAEYSSNRVTVGGQVGQIDHARITSAYLVYPGETFKPYVRAAAYDGPLQVIEYGVGMSITAGRLSVRGGYEWVGPTEGPTGAVSWRL